MEVIVRVIQPVLADRAEDVELEGVLERGGLVLDPRRSSGLVPLVWVRMRFNTRTSSTTQMKVGFQ